MGWESSIVVRFGLVSLLQDQQWFMASVSRFSSGYNLHRFSDALGLVMSMYFTYCINICHGVF